MDNGVYCGWIAGIMNPEQFIRRTFDLVELLGKPPNIVQYQNSDKKLRGILISKHKDYFIEPLHTK
jgi:hypothetical protein